MHMAVAEVLSAADVHNSPTVHCITGMGLPLLTGKIKTNCRSASSAETAPGTSWKTKIKLFKLWKNIFPSV